MARHRWTIPAGSEGFQTIVGPAWEELTTIPKGEEGARWIVEALAEREQGDDTARQRAWAVGPEVAEQTARQDWPGASGEGLVAWTFSWAALRARVQQFERIPFESGRTLSPEEVTYLVLMRIYENAEVISPQQAAPLVHAAWTCLHFGPGADEEIHSRATETDASGRATPRAHGVKAAFLAGTLLAAQKGNLGMVQHEQDDALATYRAWFQRDEWTRALLKKMGEEPDAMLAPLLLLVDLLVGVRVHAALARALDGGLDALAERTRQYAEREFKKFQPRRQSLDALSAEDPVGRRELARIKQRARELGFDFDSADPPHALLGAFAVDLRPALTQRDQALVERMTPGRTPLTEAEAGEMGFESAREARAEYDLIQQTGRPALDRDLLDLHVEGHTLNEIAQRLAIPLSTVDDHLKRIIRFARRLLIGK